MFSVGLTMNRSVLPAFCRQRNLREALPTGSRQRLFAAQFDLFEGWDTATWKPMATLRGHLNEVLGSAINPGRMTLPP